MLLEVPTFIYSLMFVVVGSAIPLLMTLFVSRLIVKSGRKLIRSTYK